MTQIIDVVIEKLDTGDYVAMSGNMKGLYVRASHPTALEQKIKETIVDIYKTSHIDVIVSKIESHNSAKAVSWTAIPVETALSELRALNLHPENLPLNILAREQPERRQSGPGPSAESLMLRRNYRAAR